MIKACSHLVVATDHVAQESQFFENLFEVKPHFTHAEFVEFVLPSKFRIAFFKPVGKAALYFKSTAEREAVSFGVTVDDVQKTYEKALTLNLQVSGPPKDHPWGEKSFLLIDPDNNRWEITQSPSQDGHLVNR